MTDQCNLECTLIEGHGPGLPLSHTLFSISGNEGDDRCLLFKAAGIMFYTATEGKYVLSVTLDVASGSFPFFPSPCFGISHLDNSIISAHVIFNLYIKDHNIFNINCKAHML